MVHLTVTNIVTGLVCYFLLVFLIFISIKTEGSDPNIRLSYTCIDSIFLGSAFCTEDDLRQKVV